MTREIKFQKVALTKKLEARPVRFHEQSESQVKRGIRYMGNAPVLDGTVSDKTYPTGCVEAAKARGPSYEIVVRAYVSAQDGLTHTNIVTQAPKLKTEEERERYANYLGRLLTAAGDFVDRNPRVNATFRVTIEDDVR